MKRVSLLGDSIRMGYQQGVVDRLAGRAEVWTPDENCLTSVNILSNSRQWLIQQRADVVHLNAGLHDIRTVRYSQRENVVPPELYRRNVRLLLQIIQDNGAIPIWATMTPVRDDNHEAHHTADKDFRRFNADVVTFNAIAREVCTSLSVSVNDLYFLVVNDLPALQDDDGVHFQPAGYAFLAGAVAGKIASVAGI